MRSRVLAILVLLACASAMGAQPATKPTAEQRRSIANELYNFVDPAEASWTVLDYKPDAGIVSFIIGNEDARIQLELLPKDANVDPGIAQNVAVAVIKQLKAKHQAAGQKMIMPPKAEKDSRFAIRIHEKYELQGKTVEQLHLYRSIGPRVLLLSVYSTSDDGDTVATELKAGEEMMVSVKYNRKAFKPDR